MNEHKPLIGTYLGDEEKSLIEAIENGEYDDGKSLLTSERKQKLQEAARNTSNGKRTKITIRVDYNDLSQLKSKALHQGIPYQTLINSILHQAARS
ncbi:MAG: DNA-binding protein [Pseudomonadota bacterium]